MEYKKVKHVEIKKGMKVNDLVKEFSGSGAFGAGKIAKAADIFEKMVKDKDCKVFFGLAGAMVPAGMKKIIIEMLRRHYIDVFVVTGANLTHDLIEALGHAHYQGSADADDEELHKKKIDRIYDIFMKDEVYVDLEKFFEKIYNKFTSGVNIKEFLWELGKNVEYKDSILRVCYEEKIPIFCPAISDSGIGLMIWGRLVKGENIESKLKKPNKLKVDVFDDLREILDIAWAAKKCGVVYIGGGVPKNFIQQAMQFSDKQDGADYGIQITTDRPESGGSSGAPLKEGVSWGKMCEHGQYINVPCDATIALPLIFGALIDRI